MTSRACKQLGLAAGVVLLIATSTVARSQVIEGSLAAELQIGADGIAAQAVFSGSAGVGIPLPSVALGIAPGEPVLFLNTDLNIVAIAGGALEDATGGVIPNGAAQSVIRTGLSGGNVVQAITNQASAVVARAVEKQSGGFVPAATTRAILTTATSGGDVGDALESALVGIVVEEAKRLIAGQLGSAVQAATAGFVDSNTVERLFNGAVNGRDLGPLFRDALQQRIGSIGQGNNNPVVIVNVALSQSAQ